MPDVKENVLVVDDKECIRSAMSLVLTEIGYRVDTAEDGFSALRKIRREIPDILLSDLHMPGMSGFRLLTVVRRRFPQILVIAMSGAFSGREVPSGIPADAFYQKGSSTMALLQILRTPPNMKRPVSEPRRAVAALSIHWDGKDPSRKAEVAITCPECLRTFLQVFDGSDSTKCEVECTHCSNSIQFEIVESSDQRPLQTFHHEVGASFSMQRASTLRI